MVQVSKKNFRGATGVLLTKVLFWENCIGMDKSYVLYTLKNEDFLANNGVTYPSLYRLYMELEDETEWEFANKYLDSYEHWERIVSAPWFKEYIERWRKELELKLRNRHLKNIKDMAEEGGREGFQANKYLLDKAYLDKPKAKRGRPSKKEIAQATEDILSETTQVNEDYKKLLL